MVGLLEEVEDLSAPTPLERGEECYNRAFFDLFSLFVGKENKRFTPSEISAATGISSKTIENYCQRISAPNFANLSNLCKVMPFEFKSRFIAMLGGNDLAIQIRRDHADILEELALKMRAGEL